MGISGILGAVAAGGSLMSGLGGLFGNSGAQAPPQFQMPGLGEASGGALGGIGNLNSYNLYQPNIPQATGITQNLVNNPYAGGYLGGSVTAGGLGQLQALGQYGQGQNLINTGQSLTPYAGSVLQTGFDPQQQLYQRTLATTLGQQQAANALSGVGTTPYGAGLTDANLQNFNIDWQNAQLNRQIQALQGAGGALQTGGGLIGQGVNMQAAAPAQYLTASSYPYSAYQQIGGNQLGALTNLGQFGMGASQLPQQQIADYLNYIQAGNQANQVANQNATLQAQIQNMYQGQIGQGLAGFGNLASKSNFNFGGGALPNAVNPGFNFAPTQYTSGGYLNYGPGY